jgi:hypothetical protein
VLASAGGWTWRLQDASRPGAQRCPPIRAFRAAPAPMGAQGVSFAPERAASRRRCAPSIAPARSGLGLQESRVAAFRWRTPGHGPPSTKQSECSGTAGPRARPGGALERARFESTGTIRVTRASRDRPTIDSRCHQPYADLTTLVVPLFGRPRQVASPVISLSASLHVRSIDGRADTWTTI